MNGCTRKVFKDKDHVKVFQTKLDSLQMHDFHFGQRDDEDWLIRQVDEAVGRRLQQDVASVRYTVESEFSEGNIDFELVILRLGRLLDLGRETLEFPVQQLSTSSVLLFLLNLVVIAVSGFALLVTRLVVHGVTGFPDELDILGLFLAVQQDRSFEVDVNDRMKLIVTWLEEEVLDVAEKDV